MPSGDGKMRIIFQIILAPIPSSDMLSIAMQALSPQSSANRRAIAPRRGNDAASFFDNPAPHLYSFPGEQDGKMQLQARSLSPYTTPPNSDTRTQTHSEKACFPQMESGTTLTSKCGKRYSCYRIVPEKLIGNRASTTKRMCFVGVLLSPPTALSPYSGFHRMLHRGDNGNSRVSLAPRVARFNRGSNGFDIIWNETNASRGCLVGHVKPSRQNITDNTNPVNSSVAMSVAQADAVLAKYGYAESAAFAV